MSDALLDFTVQVLRNVGAQLAGAVMILVVVGIPVVLAVYLFFRRWASRKGVHIAFDWNQDGGRASPPDQPPLIERSPPPDAFDPRRFLVLVYKILMLIVAFALLAGSAIAFWTATAGNGLALVGFILLALSLIAFMSTGNYDRQKEEAGKWRGIWRDLSSKIEVSTEIGIPEVHKIDGATLASAQQMANDGASLDAICRTIEPVYDAWGEPKRQAFRDMMKSVLAQQPGGEASPKAPSG